MSQISPGQLRALGLCGCFSPEPVGHTLLAFSASHFFPSHHIIHAFLLSSHSLLAYLSFYQLIMSATFEKWGCDACNGGPYVYAVTPKCTTVLSDGTLCNHEPCPSCPKDNDIKPPLSSSNALQTADHSHPAAAMVGGGDVSPYYAVAQSNAGYGQTALSSDYYLTSMRAHSTADTPRYMPAPQSLPFINGPHRQHFESAPPSTLSHELHYGQRHPALPFPSSAPITTRAGMWICCHCRGLNNRGLTCGRCTFCTHEGPCGYCLPA